MRRDTIEKHRAEADGLCPFTQMAPAAASGKNTRSDGVCGSRIHRIPGGISEKTVVDGRCSDVIRNPWKRKRIRTRLNSVEAIYFEKAAEKAPGWWLKKGAG